MAVLPEPDQTPTTDPSWVPPPPSATLPTYNSDARMSATVSGLSEFSGYTILRELGRGGNGVVLLARHEELQREVAIKVLRAGCFAAESDLERLKLEAVVAARLRHPHIVQIYSFERQAGQALLVQEYVQGGSLQELLQRQKLTPTTAARLVRDLAQAVAFAHQQGVVHRDLKPANVLVETPPPTSEAIVSTPLTPKIGDFGLAKQMDSQTATATNAVLGTPAYMAPEQARGDQRQVGPPADVYALGAILYELIVQRPPFTGASAADIMEQVRNREPVAPRLLQPDLPRDLETICLKAMDRDLVRRYHRAADLADDLERFLDGRPILARPAGAAHRLAKWVRRKPALAASLATAGVALLALLFGGVIYQALLRSALAEAQTQADRARLEQHRANDRYRMAVKTLDRMLNRLNDLRWTEVPRLLELQRQQREDALAFYAELAALEKGRANPTLRADTANALFQAARLEQLLGKAELAQEHLQAARQLVDELLRDEPNNLEVHRLDVAVRLWYASHVSSAENPIEQLREASQRAEFVMQQSGANEEDLNQLARTIHNTAIALRREERWPEAELEFRRSLTVLTPLPSVASVEMRRLLASMSMNFAVALQTHPGKGDEVRQLYQQSLAILEGLVREQPGDSFLVTSLAESLLNWGIFLSHDVARRAEAGPILTRGIELIEPLWRQEPEQTRTRHALMALHGSRAYWLEPQGRWAEAAADWVRVVELAPAEKRFMMRCFLAMALAEAGEAEKAHDLVVQLTPELPAGQVGFPLHLAEVLGVCVSKLESHSSLSPAEQGACRERWSQEAVALLRTYAEWSPSEQRAETLQSLPGRPRLASLTGHAGFQALVADQPNSP
ncbi:MAG TPA: protein kinase [Gemmatales bacterium]|nr:protein kinase [Gemmatales bacterium]